MDLGVSNRVIARNNMGRFIAECEEAGRRTVEHAVEEGAKLSREMAPVGHKHDRRTVPLAQSIVAVYSGGTSGYWYSSARHALPQEFGAAPHVIEGNLALAFYWEKMGRRWVPAEVFYNEPGLADVINHPGNPPQPFLRPAYDEVMDRVMTWARRYYPS